MEVESIHDIFNLGWLNIVLQKSKVILAKLGCVFGCEGVLHRVLEASFIFTVDCFGSRLCKAFTIKVFTSHLRDVTGIPWHVLSFYVLVGPSDPVLTLPRGVTILKLIVCGVLLFQVDVVIVLVVVRFADCYIDVMRRGLLCFLCN